MGCCYFCLRTEWDLKKKGVERCNIFVYFWKPNLETVFKQEGKNTNSYLSHLVKSLIDNGIKHYSCIYRLKSWSHVTQRSCRHFLSVGVFLRDCLLLFLFLGLSWMSETQRCSSSFKSAIKMSYSYLHITHFLGFAAGNKIRENILHENVQVLRGSSVDCQGLIF